MEIQETPLLITTAIVTAISALFCIISLATPYWSLYAGLYCSGCSTAASGLSIIAFILLVAATVLLSLYICRILPGSTRFISLVLLFIAGICTLASFASYWDSISGYSYKLMVVSNVLCYIASILAAFWLGGLHISSMRQT
jgi:hypothetical protein